MFITDCKHPGCKNYANYQVPMKDWDCGMHEQPRKRAGYLPTRHPAKAEKDQKNERV